MCFRAWFHDTKLEIHSRKMEEGIVAKHFMMWKKRIDLNSIATEMVRLSNCIALSVAELRGRILGLYLLSLKTFNLRRRKKEQLEFQYFRSSQESAYYSCRFSVSDHFYLFIYF